MFSTCSGGSYSLQPLPSGDIYSGPSGPQGVDLCLCNTIAYSLICACDGCQAGGTVADWSSWSVYAANCTTILPPGTFPYPIPAGTSLQRWAIADIPNGSTWSTNFAQSVGDTPELGPGTILGPNGPSFSSSIAPSSTIFTPAYSSSSPTQVTTTTTSNPRPAGHKAGGHSSNAGAIAGGTVAGVAAISIVVVALFFYRQRRLSQARKPNVIEDPPLPTSGQETATSTLPGTSSSVLRPYNPEDPTTFLGHQAPPNPSPTSAQAPSPSSSNLKHVYTVATPPGPHTQGYGG
ncbi:hypothetical protein BGY98DRAFT_1011216 [Russula aff. rugulosa BPL654]|nr:hypothetical protein BGY98DRAFT_1011216 [Russula aff. rugulosa BPL654]